MCSVIKGRASSPVTFQMDVKPGERILNTLKYRTENRGSEEGVGWGAERVKSPNL